MVEVGMMRRKKRDWVEKFMWLKLAIGLFFTFLCLAMLVYGSLTATTDEESVRAMVQWGLLGVISLIVATAGTWRCLG